MTSAPPPSNAASMRAPRSPCGWRRSVMAKRPARSRNEPCEASGAHHSVTLPTRAATAVATVRSVSLSCSTAAAWAPLAGMSRVLAKPGIGAFARMAMSGVIAIGAGEPRRVGAEEIAQAQLPHQPDRAPHAVPPPAAARCGDARRQAGGAAEPLEPRRQRDVLHQGDAGEAAGLIERRACHEHRLVAGGDAGCAR